MGRPFNPAQSLRALAHGKVHGGSGKDDRSHGSERRNRSTAYPLGVGDRPWVILPVPCRQISAKFFGMVVARDGVEPADASLFRAVVTQSYLLILQDIAQKTA